MTTLNTKRKRFFAAYANDGTKSRVKWEKRHKKLFGIGLPFYSDIVLNDKGKVAIPRFPYRAPWHLA